MENIFTDTQIHGYTLRWFLSFLVFIAMVSQLHSQGTRPSVKVAKLFDKADAQIKDRQFGDALETYHKAQKRDPLFSDTYMKLANLYTFLRVLDSAYNNYHRYFLLADKNQITSKVARALSVKFFRKGDYPLASDAFSLYLRKIGEAELSLEDSLMRQSLGFALDAAVNGKKVKVFPLSDSVNRFRLQYFPVLTIDNQKIYFTRRLGRETQYDEDIMMASKSGGEWGKARSISRNINSEYNEGACTVSADGRALIFTACEGRQTFGNCDLYVTNFDGNKWSKAENLGSAINSPYWDSQPSLSADGKTLYFASNRPGGEGKRDIWMSKLENGSWQKPTNLGKNVNTKFDDTTPFIHVNGEALFFSSDGRPGMGGFDLFQSEKGPNGWEAPVNLGYPINDHQDQLAIFVVPGGEEAYFTSDTREGSFLYRFEMQDELFVKRPASYLTGEIRDKRTNAPIEAEILLYDLTTQEKLYQSSSDQQGRYFVALKANGEYGAYITGTGYLFEDLRIEVQSNDILRPDTVNISLKPLLVGESVVLENIYFEFDSYKLSSKSFSELKEIARFLADSRVLVEIGGHTDQSGSAAYNLDLSKKRAEAVYNYLLELGVPPSQLLFQGYGASKPLVQDQETMRIAENRRIEFKIIQNLPD